MGRFQEGEEESSLIGNCPECEEENTDICPVCLLCKEICCECEEDE